MENMKDHNPKAKVVSINSSTKKGIKKTPIQDGKLIENWGLEGDVHAQEGNRQISLLALESIQKQKACPKINTDAVAELQLQPGDFAENITTSGIELKLLSIGQKIKVGEEALIEVSKIGKECHRYCAIYYTVGDCIMPREGVFAKVIKGGIIKAGDSMELMP